MEQILTIMKKNKIVVVMIIGLVIGVAYLRTHQPETKVASSNIEKVSSTKAKSSSVRSEPKKLIVVDVQGAVKNPGVYRVNNNSIVHDAINFAGGLSENADVKQVNQAKKITDSMQIYVPIKGEGNISSTSDEHLGSTQDGGQVNINTAKVEDFQKVHGIGPKKAQKIIDYRQKNGDYKQIEDLKKVGGFGDKTISSLKDSLTV